MSQDVSTLSTEEKRKVLERLIRERQRQPRQAPLTPGQRRLWQLQSLDSSNPVYNISIAHDLRGDLDVECLERAVRMLVHRHESLRTTIAVVHNEPVQSIPPDSSISLTYIDLSGMPQAERDSHRDGAGAQGRRHAVRSAHGPLVRFTLLRSGLQEFLFQVTAHHIVSDRWSLGILAKELSILYNNDARGVEPTIEPVGAQYADFTRWQVESSEPSSLEQELEYWAEKLRDPLAALRLPSDQQLATNPTWQGDRREFAIAPDLASRVKSAAVGHGVTDYVVLLSAFAATLYRFSQQTDMVVCVPVAGRHRPQTRESWVISTTSSLCVSTWAVSSLFGSTSSGSDERSGRPSSIRTCLSSGSRSYPPLSVPRSIGASFRCRTPAASP